MQQHEEGVKADIELDRAFHPQLAGIARRQRQLADPLQHDNREHDMEDTHRSPSIAKPAVNPGPSAIINARPHADASAPLRASMRSSTNKTLAADMLP